MRLFYNSNGFAHHRLEDVVDILADFGYDGLALTPDVPHLDPYRALPLEVERFRAHCERRGVAITLESGARFVLDPRRKHHPTLLSSAGHGRRLDYYLRLVDMAQILGAPIVSIWSGAAEPDTPPLDAALDLLAARLEPLMKKAGERGVTIAFEPEPGMLVDTVERYRALARRLAPAKLALTIDLGHLAVSEAPPYDKYIADNGDVLALVHADDSKVGRHEHLPIGEGDLDFQAIANALKRISYGGPVAVELSRHSHDAVRMARETIEALRRLGIR
jgi:L-ribulose-5-phosphate 3-epimerase